MASWLPLLTALAGVVSEVLKMRPDERDKAVARMKFVVEAIKKDYADDLEAIDKARERAAADPNYGRVRPD
jgi:hypothetical protein